jgi:hypothetical protein
LGEPWSHAFEQPCFRKSLLGGHRSVTPLAFFKIEVGLSRHALPTTDGGGGKIAVRKSVVATAREYG